MRAIEKKMSFCAAHILDLEEGHPCGVIHGHNYDLLIRIESKHLDKSGFIIDFNELKKFKTNIIDKLLDHSTIITKRFHKKIKDLDDMFGKVYILPVKYKNTTVEMISEHICSLLIDFLDEIEFHNYNKIVIRLSETDTNFGEFTWSSNDDDEVTNSILEDRINDIYEKIEELEDKIGGLEELEDKIGGLEELEEKIESIDEKLDHLKNVCDELEEETDNNDSELNQLKEDVLNIVNTFNDLEGRVEDIENLLEME